MLLWFAIYGHHEDEIHCAHPNGSLVTEKHNLDLDFDFMPSRWECGCLLFQLRCGTVALNQSLSDGHKMHAKGLSCTPCKIETLPLLRYR